MCKLNSFSLFLVICCMDNDVIISVEEWSLISFFFFDLTSDSRLQGMGFERGWGDTAERVLEMMHLLLDILQAPDPSTLETFLGRVPMVFNVVILSPHGYFGQANVLGLPDTGGQVNFMYHKNNLLVPIHF